MNTATNVKFIRPNKIKAFVTDIDGCLTNGLINILSKNSITTATSMEEIVSFNVLDGVGLSMLSNLDIPFFAISGRSNDAFKIRLEHLKFTDYILGSSNKIVDLKEMLKPHGIKISEIAYVGDDLIDYEVIEESQLSYAPENACYEIKQAADNILKSKGGEGAIREAIEHILINEFNKSPLEVYLNKKSSIIQ